MTLPRAPMLDPRRSSDFESELVARARAWIALWGLADGEPDFGQALLQIAARFNSEVAERLDLVGDKAARGFLDWLAIRGDAARPARMPIAFKLAETAREPVQAPHPVKMQVDVADATVTFETETDIRIVPGSLDLIVGVDPGNDAVFLPPPGLSNLDPLEPAPMQWRLKDFAAPGSARLQFDPGAGLDEGMLVEIAGAQYTIREPKGDLATIDPVVPAGEGFAGGTLVTKVDAFHPFDGARNQQNHILYLGDADLLNVEAQAVIDVIGAKTLGAVATWEYWGKIVRATNALPSDDEPQWRALTLKPADAKKPGTLVLSKPKGSIEPIKVGDTESRWIRARTAHLTGDVPLLTGDGISLRINALAPGDKPAISNIDPATHPPAEAIVNTTPAPTSRFYLLGREPRLFDTLYIGCAEAFSKPGAKAWVQFNLAASVFSSFSALNAGPIGFVLAGVDTSGALQLFRINPDGTLVRLAGREPMTPGQDVTLNADIVPVMWLDGTALSVASVGKDNKVYVWQEVWPLPFLSGWHDLGSPPKHTAADSPVLGLVLTHDTAANDRKLVALRDKRLSKRPATIAASAWVNVVVKKTATTVLDIDGITQIRHENSALDARKLLAVSGSLAQTLYSVDVNATLADELLIGIAPDVRPFAIQRNAGVIEAVAVKSTHDNLLAARGTALTWHVALVDLRISKATLGGRIEGGQFAAYGIASTASGAQALVAWLPFGPGMDDIVFRDPPDAAVGGLRGGLTIVDPPGSASLAILPGNNKGEIFAAELGGARISRSAPKTGFLSALAVSQPFPTINIDDQIGPDDGTGALKSAKITATATAVGGRGDYSNQRFYWLDTWIDRPTDTASFPIFPTSLTTFSGTIQTSAAPVFELKLDVADLTTAQNDWVIVVDPLTPGFVPRVARVSNVAGGVATLSAETAVANTAVRYRSTNTQVQGRIFPALKLDSTNSNWTDDALDRGAVYFPTLDPNRQHAIACFADGLHHPQWLAFESRWINAPTGVTRFVVDGEITKWAALFGDSSANPALTWEYWNGSGWRWLNADDQTSNFRNSGLVIFTVPPDLTPVDWAGKTNHWIRARLVGGDYGREKVVVKTKTNTDGTTEQTIDRTTEGIQPPFAIDFQVSYSIDTAVAPSFLLTEDSLTLRDQSDANRTLGAQIDVFTPLIYTLTHFDRDASKPKNGSQDCVPDCDCPSGSASASPAKKPPAPPPPPPAKSSGDCDCTSGTSDSASASDARAGRRALYLGLSSKLIGEPINVLLAAQEQNNDALVSLTVEALIGDRFVPVVAKDGTRALGESGVVSMSFSVEPVPMELFGQTLSWLRLTPGSGGAEWNPVLFGAYLNAVWARSAETMTRELVGSSEGAPDLTLQLARPPLLHNSLELRVRELLGIEEREQLLQSGPDRVKSGVQDLPGDWVLWTQVGDPHDCEATDRVYALDEDTGTIQFGDGRYGAIPPIGVDAVVAFQYARTDPSTGDDVPANQVSPRTALNLVTPIESVEAAVAAGQSAGGLAPESADRVVKFGASKLRHRGRAVTARDFEDIALEEFASVVQARCFVRAGKIQLVVVMRGADPTPSRSQRRELRAVLLDASSAAVSAPGVLTISGPTVRRLRIDLTLRVPTLDFAGAVANEVKATLKSYFDTQLGGESREGWPLGSSPNEDDIAEALLDMPDLESVASIALLEISSDGAEQPWPASIRTNELVMLADDGIRIEFQIVEAVV